MQSYYGRIIIQAIQGLYDNGTLKLERQAPSSKSRVIILFMENESQKKMSTDEAMRIFIKHTGSVKWDIELKKEKYAYFNEKHGYSFVVTI